MHPNADNSNRERRSLSGWLGIGATSPFRWVRYTADAVAWTAAIVLAALLRYDFRVSKIDWLSIAILCIAACVLQLVIGTLVRLYQGRYIRGTFEEVRSLVLTTAATAFILWVTTLIIGPLLHVPRSTMMIAFPIAILMMSGARYVARAIDASESRPTAEAIPALILGAGYIGTHLVQWTSSDRESPYRPVGLIDDDPIKRGMRIRDVEVLGTLVDVPMIAANTGAQLIVVAVGDADSALLRRVQDIAQASGLQVKVMPPLGDVVRRGVRGQDLRDLSIEDLLGRQVVETNVSEIADYMTGKRVLVTGAGGSIGSQLCVEIKKYGPSELIMLDRDETGLQQVQINVSGQGLLDTNDVVLADIRDRETLVQIFRDRQPQVVFHAAALKHLPMLEQYPDESWKTNVLGTLNVLEAARKADVQTFVNISTDKAANPTSFLGHSKRTAEQLTSWMGHETGRRYLSVRFGNVIGSRGSMLPTFTRLIEENRPVTVTHPDVTRFFMTIPEACQLVLQAGGIGRVGEVLILDMGEPVKILEIAERMISLSGKNLEIVFTGLREGEKMDEELVGEGETAERPFHPKISHAIAPPVAPETLDRAIWRSELEDNGSHK